MKKHKHEITGHLDIFVADFEEEFEGEIEKWQNILIHGNPEGLRSFAKILIQIADLNQDSITDLPIGAREHIHLRPDIELSKSSLEVIVGRIDAKGTGVFYDRYVAKSEKEQ
ncbi:Imm32 family immunity protein [Flavitalea antarctica]